MIPGPLFGWRPPPVVERAVETVAVEVLTVLARAQGLVESPPVEERRTRAVSCGCVRRERRRPVGWIGYGVKACELRAAGKSCAAVRGED